MTVITDMSGAPVINIDSVTDTLITIANWQADLLDRIERTKLIFQLHDCFTDFQPLVDEVAAFKRVTACIAWR